MERSSEKTVAQPLENDEKEEIRHHMQTFNVLHVARDVFGGAEKRLRDLIDIMDPEDLLIYLLNQGWKENTKFPEPGGKILSYGENHELVVFLPLDKEYLDYQDHMFAALRVIAETTPMLGRL